MELLVGIVLAVLTPFLGYWWALRRDKAEVARIRRQQRSDGTSIVSMPTIAIADALVPLICGLRDHRGSEITVVGYDGRYIVKQSGESWRSGIMRWIEEGIDVTYILLLPGQGVTQGFNRLIGEARDLEDEGKSLGRLKIQVLQQQSSQQVQAVVREMETFHPTLFTAQDGRRAMWLEGLHEPDSEYAYNVRYFSPEVMERVKEAQDIFAEYKEKISILLKSCKELPAVKERRAV